MLLQQRYRLGPQIARDRSGALFEAVDERLTRPVTIRLLGKATSELSEDDLSQFDREVRILGAISDPAFMRVYDVAIDGAQPFVVLEPLRGSTLDQCELSLPLDDSLIDLFVESLAKALAAAHRLGFVHGAIRPAHIFVCEESHARWVKLLGFGHGRKVGARFSSDVRAEPLSSAIFFAPEVLQDLPLDPRTDVYGVAAIAYFMLTGEAPHEAENLFANPLKAQMIPLSTRRPDLSLKLSTLLSASLALDRDARPPSMESFFDAWTAARRRPHNERTALVPVGTTLEGDFQVIAHLGRGAYGEVLLARDENLQRSVAIKLLSPQAWSERELEHFTTEARAMASIDHPNVARVYSVGEHQDAPFLVMEYVAGSSLDVILSERGRLSPADTLEAVRQIAEGLDAIHEARLTHADLKPANCLVGPGFRVVVSDFGLLQPTGLRGATQRARYMAPERIQENVAPQNAHLVDVYALGVMTYELLTGVHPFDTKEPLKGLLHQIAGTAPTPPSALVDEPPLSAQVDAAIAHAMAPDPAQRTPSCRAFFEELEEALHVTGGLGEARFLIADDDPMMCQLAELYLKNAFPEASVKIAASGEEALRAIGTEHFDVVLLDLFLEDMDAKDVARRLRSDLAEPPALVVMTGTGSAADWQILSALGVQAFLVKPLDSDLLALTIKRVLDVDQSSPQPMRR